MKIGDINVPIQENLHALTLGPHRLFCDGINYIPLVKDAPVYPMLKEMREDALKH